MLAILGDPVAHSVSPALHNAAIAAMGLGAVYVPLRVEAQALHATLDVLTQLGVAGNLTVPHKVAAVARMTNLTARAERVGAVNTFWADTEGLHGDNTDVAGMLAAADRVDALGPWILAGTGGAARAVAIAAAECGASLLVRSRRPERAEEFAEWATERGAEARPDDGSSAATAINATPVGFDEQDAPPIPDERLDGVRVVIDLVYRPGETTWVRAARARGARAVDGRWTLIGQGIAAFERFFPGVEAPRDLMVTTVERALRP